MDNQFPLPGPTALSPEPQSPPVQPVSPLPTPEAAAPPPPGYEPPASTNPPVVHKAPTKLLIIVGAAVLFVILIVFLLAKIFGSRSNNTPASTSTAPTKITTITYFGLWEPNSVMQPVIDAFQKQNPSIKVNYQLQSPQDYQDRLQTALQDPNPPDVVRLHTTWLPLFAKNLLIAPPNTISVTEINTNFYPIISQLLVSNNQIYGVPLTVDGLALYINTAMLQQKNLQTPKTWEDLLVAAKSLTETDSATGKITRAGVALGNTANVDNWPDIVSLMFMQAGVKLSDLKGEAVTTTLSYYTDFVTKYHVWDDTLPPSVVAFANEKVAMIIAPSWRAQEIKQINPSLSWQVAPVPQLPDIDPINWASIWFEGVAKGSKHPQEAWKFLSFLASANAQQLLFDAATADRAFPQPPANKAVATIASQNPVVAAYLSGMNNAHTFYTASSTRDSATALNSRLIKYLEDAINSSGRSQETNKILQTLQSGFTQVLSGYGLAPSPTSAPTP